MEDINRQKVVITYKSAVDIIKTAILQSQARAAKAVNQEQLALYYGIGRYVSANTRKKNWGNGAIDAISNQLKLELPGLRGFSARNIKNMRTFYEEWQGLENHNSAVTTAKFTEINAISAVVTAEIPSDSEIRQLQLANLPDFPLKEFLSISFTHHITILAKAKAYEERIFYMKYADTYKPTVEDLEKAIVQDLYHHQDKMPNNFLATIPDYKQAYRAIRMFKDEYLLDFINVEELGMHDEDVDESVIESNIVHNVKNFIMTFGRGFTFSDSQVHFDKLGHDHWIDLLFFNRDLNRTVVFELKNGNFKASLSQEAKDRTASIAKAILQIFIVFIFVIILMLMFYLIKRRKPEILHRRALIILKAYLYPIFRMQS